MELESLAKALDTHISPIITIPYASGEITVEVAISLIGKTLKNDINYANGWQSYLAVIIMNNSNIQHDQANTIAKKILESLMNQGGII